MLVPHKKNLCVPSSYDACLLKKKKFDNVRTYPVIYFLETQYKHKRSHTRAYTHPYEHTHVHPTPMSTSERLNRRIGSWDWWSHHRRLAIDGNVASHWKDIPPLWDIAMSNLRFELWWAGGTTALLTTQPQVRSLSCDIILDDHGYASERDLLKNLNDV
jgi:hypothetical protein